MNIVAVRKGNSWKGMEKYEVMKCIGVGGFSKVYLVRHRGTGEFYAAKFMLKEQLNDKLELIVNEKKLNEYI